MPTFTPEQLQQWTGGRWTRVPQGGASGFAIDTRQIGAGEVFVALRSEKRDGHNFVPTAEAAGAYAAIVEQPVAPSSLPQLVVESPLRAFQALATAHRKSFAGPIVGITGSCGKTSTKEILSLILGREKTLRTSGNLNNYLGVPLTLLRLDASTHTAGVIEAGINMPQEMDLLGSMIEPEVGIVTLIGAAHLEKLGSLAGVAAEKVKLLHHVRQGGMAVFPASCLDYPVFAEMPEGIRPVIVGSVHPDKLPAHAWHASWSFAGNPASSQGGLIHMQIPAIGVEARIEIPAMSSGMRGNAALCIATALIRGLDARTISTRISLWQPGDDRGRIVRHQGQVFYIDCYNANPTSMQDALEYFRDLFARLPKLYVIGGMRELGANTSDLHRRLGLSLHLRKPDRAVLVGSEGVYIRQGMLENGCSASSITLVPSAEEATPFLQDFEGAILLKGSRYYRLETLVPTTAEAGAGLAKQGHQVC